MDTGNKMVAIAMEKIPLTENRALLRPIKPIVGFLNNYEDIFITSDKEEYLGAYSSIISGSMKRTCFYYDMLLSELMNKYFVDDVSEAISNYFDEISEYLHIATCKEDGELEVNEVLYDELGEFNSDCTLLENNGHVSIELNKEDIDKLLNADTFDDIKDKLKTYRNYLEAFGTDNSAIDVNKTIDSLINKNEDEHHLAVIDKPIKAIGDTNLYVNKNKNDIDVSSLYNNVIASVKAQDEPIEDIVTTIATNHMSNDKRNKSHILVTGPTGVGKTEILECISKYINVPMAKYDMTQVSVTGYVGKSVEDILIRLYLQANKDIKAAENGILALDEIDKKASDKNDDVSGRGVLNSLLKLLDGTTYDLEIERGAKKVPFDTSNLTVVAMGAFANMKVNQSNPLGFATDTPKQNVLEKIDIDDYVKFGIPAELMGRFTTLVTLNDLSTEDLKSILLTSKISPLIIKQEFLKDRGIRLNYTDAYIEEVAKRALKLKTGARSLKATVEYSLKKAQFQILKDRIYKELIIDGETVSNNKVYVLK